MDFSDVIEFFFFTNILSHTSNNEIKGFFVITIAYFFEVNKLIINFLGNILETLLKS